MLERDFKQGRARLEAVVSEAAPALRGRIEETIQRFSSNYARAFGEIDAKIRATVPAAARTAPSGRRRPNARPALLSP